MSDETNELLRQLLSAAIMQLADEETRRAFVPVKFHGDGTGDGAFNLPPDEALRRALDRFKRDHPVIQALLRT